MTKKNAKNVVAHCGVVIVVPGNNASLGSSGKKAKTEPSEMQTGYREIYKGNYSGYSSGYSVKKKSGEIVDRKTGRVGYKEETTYSKSLGSSGKKAMTESSEMQTGYREIYKGNYSGYSSGYSVKEKSGEIVNRKTGRVGYKEETTYSKSLKFDDKVSGSSTEYETQVKFKKVYTPGPASAKHVAPKSNNYKSSGSKSSKKSWGYY